VGQLLRRRRAGSRRRYRAARRRGGGHRGPPPPQVCNPEYVLPEFGRITKCAYFDYQRDKVLFRTSPASSGPPPQGAATAAGLRGQPGRRVRGAGALPALRLGRLRRAGPLQPAARRSEAGRRRPQALGDAAPGQAVPLPPVRRRLGVRRTTSPPTPQVRSPPQVRLGPVRLGGVLGRRATADQRGHCRCPGDLFGVPVRSAVVSKLREQAAGRYQATYEALLARLRGGTVAHAMRRGHKSRGPTGGLRLGLRQPEVAVYVYAPTRRGDTVRETLAGFQGVLVSDFYAAYDSLDCPPAEVHRPPGPRPQRRPPQAPVRRGVEAVGRRFGSLMQAVVRTIDVRPEEHYLTSTNKTWAGPPPA